MTQTYTASFTFTRSDARRVGGRVVADLLQMQQAYLRPSNQQIEDYLGELIELLFDGYLDTVWYGFKRNGKFLLGTLRYTAFELTSAVQSDRSGTVRRRVDTTDAHFTSYLTYSQKWWYELDAEGRAAYKRRLPFQRVSGSEPSAPGGWVQDRSYVSGSGGVRRAVLGGVS